MPSLNEKLVIGLSQLDGNVTALLVYIGPLVFQTSETNVSKNEMSSTGSEGILGKILCIVCPSVFARTTVILRRSFSALSRFIP
jgi:hypothetical protein